EDVTLIKLAVIYHDSANTAEVFHDETKHAENFRLDALAIGFPEDKVNRVAVALKNKDKKGDRNIYQLLIHDPDCLEILRIHETSEFEIRRLDIFQLIEKNLTSHASSIALRELKQLVNYYHGFMKYIYKDENHKQCEHSKNCFDIVNYF